MLIYTQILPYVLRQRKQHKDLKHKELEAMWKASSVRSEILESMTPAERKRRRYD